MKILQLNFEKGWRGGERQTLYCMRAFRAAGHQVELLCRAGGPLQTRAGEEGFPAHGVRNVPRSEEHTSELQSLMRISYAVFCLKKKKHKRAKPRPKNAS